MSQTSEISTAHGRNKQRNDDVNRSATLADL